MTGSGRLRIGYLSTFYHTSHVLRAEDWRPDSIDVDWTLEMTGPALVRSLAAGRLDLAYIGLTPALIAISRGVPIRCVAGGHEEGTVVVAGPGIGNLASHGGDLGATLREFDGRTVGIPAAGSIHDVIFREALRTHGLEGRVPIRNFPQADLITEAIADGTISGGVGTPALAVATQRYAGAHVAVPPRALWPHNPSYGIVATESAMRDGAPLRAFLVAHEAASALIRTRPGEAARRVAESVEIADAAFVEATYRLSPRYCAALSEPFVAASLAFLPALGRLGYLERPVRPDAVFERGPISETHPGPAHYDDGLAA